MKKIIVRNSQPQVASNTQFNLEIAESASLVPNDMSYEDMLLRAKEIMNREITNLMLQSSQGKLDSRSAQDLINLVKVLQSLTRDENDRAEAMSEEEIKARLEKKS
jgi:hypothetical protein